MTLYSTHDSWKQKRITTKSYSWTFSFFKQKVTQKHAFQGKDISLWSKFLVFILRNKNIIHEEKENQYSWSKRIEIKLQKERGDRKANLRSQLRKASHKPIDDQRKRSMSLCFRRKMQSERQREISASKSN